MDESHFSWVPVPDEPGVEEKQLGQFTERRTDAAILRVAAGATHTLRALSIYFCKSGKGSIGDAPVRGYTTIHIASGEAACVSATEELIFLRMGLPDLSNMNIQGSASASLAAE
jgi:hypothetical protein